MSERGDRTRFLARVAQASLLAAGGWKYEGELPPPRAVALAVPHTSYWDGLVMVYLAQSVGLDFAWMVKSSVRLPVLGSLVERFGGVTVDRSKPNGMVGQMVEEFARRDDFFLVISPEGTRSRVDHWKSGFYRIALAANVPVVPAFLDYRRKRGGFGKPITLTGDVRRDMNAIRAHYGDAYAAMAKHPALVGPIRLREEEEAAQKAG